MSASIRHGLLVFVAVLLAQAAWTLAVPPFRGSDEFDHAFRAASVASGEWLPTESAAEGRGWLVSVPRGLATAARGQCEALRYTGEDNCRPQPAPEGAADVRIASAAGTYNPAYYTLIGWAAKPFDGTDALYVMRACSALLCALMIAASSAALWATRARWAGLSLLAAMSPVVIYSTIVVAPNGLEIAAGLGVWSAILALDRLGDAGSRGWVVALGVTCAAVLLNLRMLGPVWLALIVATALTFTGWRSALRAVARQRALSLAAASTLAVSAAIGVGWTIGSGLLVQGADDTDLVGTGGPRLEVLSHLPVWTLQMVAAFPFRDQPAPAVVYPLVLLVLAALLAAAVRHAPARRRFALCAGVVAALASPVVLTLLTMGSQGVIWQGRYALPFVVGLPVMAGLVLDEARWRPSDRRFLVLLCFVMLLLAHCVSVVSVLARELGREVSVGDAGWFHTTWLPAPALLMLGYGLLFLLGWESQRGTRSSEPERSMVP